MIPIYHISQWDLTRASFIATGANAIHFPVMPPMMLLHVHNSALTGKRDQQSSNIIVFCIAEINPSNSSKWNTKPPLSHRSMDSRPIFLFGTLESLEKHGPLDSPQFPTGARAAPWRRNCRSSGDWDSRLPSRWAPPKCRPREMLRLGTNRFSTAILLPGAPSPACPANTAAMPCKASSSTSPSLLRSCAQIPRSKGRKPQRYIGLYLWVKNSRAQFFTQYELKICYLHGFALTWKLTSAICIVFGCSKSAKI